MSRPLFSCVMPVKGSRPYFAAAMESLRAQDAGGELEIIVQDGDVEPDSGQSEALNRGFAKAKGEWLFWLNADDILLPGALAKVRDFIAGIGGLRWVAGNTVYLDQDGNTRDSRWNGRWHGFLNRHMPTWTFGPGAFFARQLWAEKGGFDQTLRFSMDIDLWTRWALSGERYAMLAEYVWGFRWHAGSLTAGGANREAQAAERRLIEDRYGFRHQNCWRLLSRMTQVVDGSYWRRMGSSGIPRNMRRIYDIMTI